MGRGFIFLAVFCCCVSVSHGYDCNETFVPVAQGFVWLQQVAPEIVEEIRYAGDHNFVGSPACGYLAAKCFLTKEAATALKTVASIARDRYRMTLKVYDCYRPKRTNDFFVEWAKNVSDTRMKMEFYPTEPKNRLFDDGYIAKMSGHNRGSTMDLTLVPLPIPPQPPFVPGEPLKSCTLPASQRFKDNSIDMGTGFDCFNVMAYTNSSSISQNEKMNRAMLQSIMAEGGFVNYPEEWWHFTLENEPYPSTYFDFQILP